MALDPVTIVLFGLVGMFVLIFLHVPVGVAMAITGVGCFWWMSGEITQALSIFKTEVVSALSSHELAVIPLFLLMGGFATAAGLSGDLYRLGQAWVGHRRGGLAVATVLACAGFGTICGSSIATAATMTRVALPEMLSRGYAQAMAAGAIAGGGSLGMLIPPSILMVLYASLTEQSILAMFAAAIVPGILTVALYVLTVSVTVRLRPEWGPPSERVAYRQRWRITAQNWRVLALAGVVSGGIYGGVFTVPEAAAVGGALAFFIYLFSQGRGKRSLLEVLGDTAATTSMLYIVIIGAGTMSYFVTLSDAPAIIVQWIEAQALPGIAVIGILVVLFVIIGSVFDTTAGMVITLPFVYPLVTSLGYDPIWWGLMMIVLIEVGMITPPIGLNVFVLHGMAPDVPLTTIFRGVLPFLFADAVRIGLMIAFPALVTWLPEALGFMSSF